MKFVTVVMVQILIGQDEVTKMARVYQDAAAAEKYRKELQDAIDKKTRPDLLATWKQESVRFG